VLVLSSAPHASAPRPPSFRSRVCPRASGPLIRVPSSRPRLLARLPSRPRLRARRPGLCRLCACCAPASRREHAVRDCTTSAPAVVRHRRRRPQIDLAASVWDLCYLPHSSIWVTKPLTPPHRRVHRSRMLPSSGISAAEPNRRARPTGSPPPRLPSARIDAVARRRTRTPQPRLAPEPLTQVFFLHPFLAVPSLLSTIIWSCYTDNHYQSLLSPNYWQEYCGKVLVL
jgi:hypothetical protein